jgi:carboxypeptidase PM20D1
MALTRRYDVAMKKLLLGTGAVLAVLIIIMIVRANVVFEDVQLAPAEGLAKIALDESGAVERLAGAIRFRTISYDDRSNFDADAFLAFHDYLQQSFPDGPHGRRAGRRCHPG